MFKKTFKKNSGIYIIIMFCVIFTTDLSAQNRFKAGVVAGINVAQIRGDDTGGFNKAGLVAGIRAITILQEKMDVSLELLYSQRGSRTNKAEENLFRDVEIDLNYIEVPVLFNYKDWLNEEDNFYHVQASIGFAYSRLISAAAAGFTNEHENEIENFNDDDFSFVVGAEYFITPKFSISGRWATSINLLYDNEKHNPNINGLRGHFLSFRTNYLF
ncbi:MAG: hypothetical protein ACI9XO_001145 [Paraglaciecola sp.]|jgi:hypothetical protein